MKSLLRRTLVPMALGAGLVYSGVAGLAHASAQTNSPSPKATATTSPSQKGSSTTKHNCPNDSNGGSSSTATSTA